MLLKMQRVLSRIDNHVEPFDISPNGIKNKIRIFNWEEKRSATFLVKKGWNLFLLFVLKWGQTSFISFHPKREKKSFRLTWFLIKLAASNLLLSTLLLLLFFASNRSLLWKLNPCYFSGLKFTNFLSPRKLHLGVKVKVSAKEGHCKLNGRQI